MQNLQFEFDTVTPFNVENAESNVAFSFKNRDKVGDLHHFALGAKQRNQHTFSNHNCPRSWHFECEKAQSFSERNIALCRKLNILK
jgi:hypothetical protein